MRTYLFKIVVEPDEDRWTAYCPVLLQQGASTWGDTKEEALRNIEEVVRMVVDSLRDHGEPLPEGPLDALQVVDDPCVAVSI